MENCNISIIIPIFNTEPYIYECLQSVANQLVTEQFECILVDDCGSDRSMDIVEQFLVDYSGSVCFMIIHHDMNRGLSAARNSGIMAAHGQYLYFLDSDDTITPTCLQSLLQLAKEYDSDLVQGGFFSSSLVLSDFDSIRYPIFIDNRKEIIRRLLDYNRNPVMAQNRLVNRSFIIKNNLFFKEGIIHEDIYWTFFLAKYVKRMVISHEKTYFYRSTPGSITNKINIQKEILAYQTMIKDFSENLDIFQINAQKRLIFCLLLRAVQTGYYEDDFAKKNLINCLKDKETLIKRILLLLIFHIKQHSFIHRKLINLLMKIYEM